MASSDAERLLVAKWMDGPDPIDLPYTTISGINADFCIHVAHGSISQVDIKEGPLKYRNSLLIIGTKEGPTMRSTPT